MSLDLSVLMHTEERQRDRARERESPCGKITRKSVCWDLEVSCSAACWSKICVHGKSSRRERRIEREDTERERITITEAPVQACRAGVHRTKAFGA